MDKNTVFDDIMQGLHEIEEHQKGNIKLKTSVVEIPDDDINDIYSQLNENDKYIVRGIMKRLLVTGS